MADKMMRIAGRTSGGTAVPVAADANGNIGTTRKWKKEWIELQTALEIRDTSDHHLTAYDVSEIPVFSLRFVNRLGVPVTIYLRTDINTTNGYALADKDGVSQKVTLAPTNSYITVTPDDLPILNYIRYLRITVKASSAPADGVFEAYMVAMR